MLSWGWCCSRIGHLRLDVTGSEAGSYLRLIYSCITQLKAQGPSRTCNESKEEEEDEEGRNFNSTQRHPLGSTKVFQIEPVFTVDQDLWRIPGHMPGLRVHHASALDFPDTDPTHWGTPMLGLGVPRSRKISPAGPYSRSMPRALLRP